MANIRRSTTDEYESDSNMGDDHLTASAPKLRQNLVAIPVIPRPLAIFCLVANIIVPGSGTIVSGFSVFCFHYKKDSSLEMINTCIANVVVGLCQLITVIFLLIGWFWSIIWGCALVGHSNYYKKNTTSTPIRLTVRSASPVRKDER